ncbi:MAG: methyltransferase domain-containing protein [Planctomycetes bacterium]|nr:methyltransferase domain-containing protein [Planctomycetota bacterium]
MLLRVLEPEVMDSEDEARDYDSMDHSAVNAKFVGDLLAEGPLHGPILDLGTGTAQIPIELCRRAPDALVIAIDLADWMLKLARRNVDTAGLADRIELKKSDGKRLPFADDSFGSLMSNSIVHHIPEPSLVLAEALRVTRRGGLLFFRDLLRPADDAEVNHLVATYAAGANDHQRALFDASLRAALTLDEVRERVDALGLCRNCIQQTSDRHWTFAARVL